MSALNIFERGVQDPCSQACDYEDEEAFSYQLNDSNRSNLHTNNNSTTTVIASVDDFNRPPSVESVDIPTSPKNNSNHFGIDNKHPSNHIALSRNSIFNEDFLKITCTTNSKNGNNISNYQKNIPTNFHDSNIDSLRKIQTFPNHIPQDKYDKHSNNSINYKHFAQPQPRLVRSKTNAFESQKGPARSTTPFKRTRTNSCAFIHQLSRKPSKSQLHPDVMVWEESTDIKRHPALQMRANSLVPITTSTIDCNNINNTSNTTTTNNNNNNINISDNSKSNHHSRQNSNIPSPLTRRSSCYAIPSHVYGLEKYVNCALDELSTSENNNLKKQFNCNNDNINDNINDNDLTNDNMTNTTENLLSKTPSVSSPLNVDESFDNVSLNSSRTSSSSSLSDTLNMVAIPKLKKERSQNQAQVRPPFLNFQNRRTSFIKNSLANSFAN
ncbi:hypothetical protein KAFR_0A01960 [Kazachstania africana CBS 2517]|uniref:Uncharacterized protein n=1 Tax=Kazachstania africana (strain ATCC 22294 / BCRC 22015 / CBS 2517 / CECT 1963 / NBRC 1671 / NRRL Y-8276) TaxID=1071382 RepID=H2AMN4_KAZAF|nr:hypothetical protein KAFR_0A01960 [Kazachstania africana CBS 2517]CCF55634.1 hypothetical protein KAFR_0A01960 [Kazachstania africana CBS 2517]